MSFPGSGRRVRCSAGLEVALAAQVRFDDVGRLGLGDARVEPPDQPEGQHATDDLGRDEARDRRRGDAGEVLENMRPTVMAGLAKLVELVKK